MKKFCLGFSILCYTLALAAFALIFVCSFAFNEKPDVLFYTTMAMSVASLSANGSLFMWYYHDN